MTACNLLPNSSVLLPRYYAHLKAIRYESTSLNRTVADRSHPVIVALKFTDFLCSRLSSNIVRLFKPLNTGSRLKENITGYLIDHTQFVVRMKDTSQ